MKYKVVLTDNPLDWYVICRAVPVVYQRDIDPKFAVED